jgi:3-oxoadipate enol-lactonase
MTTRFVERVALEVAGEGDPVLMIHGLGGTSNVWTPLWPALGRHRTLRPDLPGSGRSDRVEGPLTIARFVDSMRRVCRDSGLEHTHVVAHSLGTIVALHLAVEASGLVRSLTLFGPLAAPPDAARPGLRARADAALRGGVAGMQDLAETLLASTTSSETRARRPLAVALIRELLMRQSPDGYARTCEALAAAAPPDVTRIDCPTLLITGDEDAIAPAQSVRHLGSRIAGSRVEVLARCGHWTPLERPEECATLLKHFLQTLRHAEPHATR